MDFFFLEILKKMFKKTHQLCVKERLRNTDIVMDDI